MITSSASIESCFDMTLQNLNQGMAGDTKDEALSKTYPKRQNCEDIVHYSDHVIFE